MCSAVRLQRPHLHLSEALPTELCFTGERLLRDERVGADRACVDLVVDQVRQLEHIDHAHGDGVIEALTGASVTQPHLAVRREPRSSQELDHRGIESLLDWLLRCQRRDRREPLGTALLLTAREQLFSRGDQVLAQLLERHRRFLHATAEIRIERPAERWHSGAIARTRSMVVAYLMNAMQE